MYINTNLSGLIYQQEQNKGKDKPWIYDDADQDIQTQTSEQAHQTQAHSSMRLAFAAIINFLMR